MVVWTVVADSGDWTGFWQGWLNKLLTGVTEQVSGQVCLNRLLTWVTEQFAGQGWLNKLLYIQRWLNKLLDSGGWAQWTGVTGHWTGLAGIYIGRRDVCICCNYSHEIRFASSPLIQNDDSQFIFSQKVCWRAIYKFIIYKITIQSPKNLKNSHLHNFLQKNQKEPVLTYLLVPKQGIFGSPIKFCKNNIKKSNRSFNSGFLI